MIEHLTIIALVGMLIIDNIIISKYSKLVDEYKDFIENPPNQSGANK